MSHRLTGIDDAAWASPWRRRRVSEKVAFSLALVLTALLTPAWPGCAGVAVIALGCLLGGARIRPSMLAWVMAAPTTFIVLGSLPVAVQLAGQADTDTQVWSAGPLRVTAASLAAAASLIAHGLAGTLAVMVLAVTTPMVDVLTWLRALRVPDQLVDVASLMYRLLMVLLSTTLAVRAAQRARLGDAASLRRRWQATGDTCASIALRSWQHATRLQRGLEGRGYEESLTTLAVHRPRDWGFIALASVAIVAVLITTRLTTGAFFR